MGGIAMPGISMVLVDSQTVPLAPAGPSAAAITAVSPRTRAVVIRYGRFVVVMIGSSVRRIHLVALRRRLGWVQGA
jgi:hypothetical protein